MPSPRLAAFDALRDRRPYRRRFRLATVSSRHFAWACALVTIVLNAASLPAQITDQRVRDSMQAGVKYLLSEQRADGSWPDYDAQRSYASYHSGVTSLCTLALLNAGMDTDDAQIERALNYLRKQTDLDRTYTVALQTIVMCTASPKRDGLQIRKNVAWLQAAQRKNVPVERGKGSWGYEKDGDGEDPSNAQFALLALYEAERAGVPVKDSTWRLALDYWKRNQLADGSFRYSKEQPSTGSMTCAGIGSMVIASGQVSDLDATIEGGVVQCCTGNGATDESIERGLAWLGKHFSARRNPISRNVEGLAGLNHYYYLYALERVGRLAGRRFIGDHDWYREGVEVLLDLQDDLSGFWGAKGDLTSTAFSVLFLSKGRRPVLLSKIKRLPEDDWNRHRHDVAHLTRYVESRWKQDLTWQVVDLAAATVDDLQQSSILFISGRDALDVAVAEKEALKTYIELGGGFIFAENCCEGDGFDRDFRALMSELFPDSPLRLLPSDHAIWFAEQRVDPNYLRPLLGIDACCRTSVVYCPENLSCFWELAKPRRTKNEVLPDKISAEVDACLAIGANVVTYATGRELKQKLDQQGLVSVVSADAPLDRATLYIAKLQHSGGSDDAPSALSNMLAVIGQQTDLPVASEKRILSALATNLPDYPIAFVHGRRAFRWTQAERKAIRRFIDHGGVLFADAICANDEFKDSFNKEMRAIFPDHPLQRIPPGHEMFTDAFDGHDLRTVTLRDPRSRARADDPLSVRLEQIEPMLEGIQIDNRYVVMFSPYDMSCALENQPSLECRGYTQEDAAKLATNIVLYAMQQ